MMRALLSFTFLICAFFSYGGIIKSIELEGNKRTKFHIVNRELTFHVGDTLDSLYYQKEITQSQNNLLNTSLFNFATVTITDSAEYSKVHIRVVERWYIWPEVILKFQERNFTEWLKTKNFSRVDIGLYVTHLNFRGRQEKLQIQGKYGFNKKLGLLYEIPYLTKSLKAGLQFAISYNTQNEVFTDIDSTSRMVYTKNSDETLIETFNLHAEYIRRNNLYTRHYFMADYKDIKAHHELLDLKSHYFGGLDRLRFISFQYIVKDDHRDNKNYPLNGYYADFKFQQNGIGIDQKDINFFRIKANYRFYFFLASRLYLAFGTYTEAFSKRDIPFYFQDGLGFDRYVRAYEPYLMFGQYSGFVKTNLKYQIVKPKMHTIPFLKAEKFSKFHYSAFLNCFIDAGYVHNDMVTQRALDNELLLGAGIGIDLVTFYDLVFRTEYSINKWKEHGLYISFVAPI